MLLYCGFLKEDSAHLISIVQADRDRVTLQEDRSRDERNLAVTEYLVRELVAIRIFLLRNIDEELISFL